MAGRPLSGCLDPRPAALRTLAPRPTRTSGVPNWKLFEKQMDPTFVFVEEIKMLISPKIE